MKLSDYVASFLVEQGVKHVFAISGGASLHLIHSIVENSDIECVCPLHEQAGAMAADAYSRVTRNLGVAIGTSGPGGTNMVTGICGAYYDSVPVLYITGQVSTFRFKGDTGVRQYGFQETDIVSICATITKYAVTILDPKKIRFELEKATHIAKTGRPGPVLIDIPDNLQREEIDPSILVRYQPPIIERNNINQQVANCLNQLYKSRRPVLILGWGVRLSGADTEALRLINELNVPVAPTWGMADFLPKDFPLLAGTFGTHGTRYGNFAVQNADLVIAIGTRLDTHVTGSPLSSFAREAIKIVVDIDQTELEKAKKYGMFIDYPIVSDAGLFIRAMLGQVKKSKVPKVYNWKSKILKWKEKYHICHDNYYKEPELNPYVFVKELSEHMSEGNTIFVDTGCAIAWMMQGFEAKNGQRIFHDFNNTAMGYAIPASIGASFALDKQPVVAIIGDGSIHMNIQELATIIHYKLPIKIILFNNNGYSMIQQTQDQWFDSNYYASSPEGGVAAPDFMNIAAAYGYRTYKIDNNQSISSTLEELLTTDGPAFCDVRIPSNCRVIPQVKYGRPIEDSEPLLDRDEFMQQMIVCPIEESMP